ncbi:RNA polymerase sigma factor [Pedobacter gandavensis]|uniref:RNA polymerase sigma factor n=1 Tax=Pedobacter gandavensis TaxID=2679963 RepID=UPI0029319EF6|nr:sigma-70 family RNA polymerase sigma factor [Pedobacter gandavensis]
MRAPEIGMFYVPSKKNFISLGLNKKALSLNSVPTEIFLLRRVAAGDEDAFSKLFDDYQQQVSGFVFSIIGSKELTQEIVQDIFIKVWQKRGELLEIQKFDAYLFVLSKNYTLNCIRKIQREEKKATAYNSLQPDVEQPQSDIDNDDYLELIEKATSTLPPQQQRVFRLRMEGLKNHEIAAQLMISPDSVKKYQQLALKSVATFVKLHLSYLALWVMMGLMQK